MGNYSRVPWNNQPRNSRRICSTDLQLCKQDKQSAAEWQVFSSFMYFKYDAQVHERTQKTKCLLMIVSKKVCPFVFFYLSQQTRLTAQQAHFPIDVHGFSKRVQRRRDWKGFAVFAINYPSSWQHKHQRDSCKHFQEHAIISNRAKYNCWRHQGGNRWSMAQFVPFWKVHEKAHPELAKIARKLLSIPAGSDAVGRAFSQTNFFRTEPNFFSEPK